MSTFTKTMRIVGDLDDEFYDDERQRDVWNEASAVGFSLFYWASLVAACILPWTAGVTGSWIALGVLIVFLTVGSMVVSYAKSRGLDMYTSQNLVRARIYLPVALYFVAAFSVLITLVVEYLGDRSSVFVGMSIGACVGATAGVVGIVRQRRRHRDDEARAEAAELLELDKEG